MRILKLATHTIHDQTMGSTKKPMLINTGPFIVITANEDEITNIHH